jgi:serine protease Do
MNRLHFIAIGLLSGTVGAALMFYMLKPGSSTQHIALKEEPAKLIYTAHTPPSSGALKAPSFANAAAVSVDAVVHVKTIQRSTASASPWYELFGYESPTRVAQGSGSGVIIDPSGYIITNHHVIQSADQIQVSLNNNRTYVATVMGTDAATDLAVLKIDVEHDIPALTFGASSDVEIGEWVLAVGNPFDLTSTVTAGIVSAKARSINILRGDPRTMEYPVESFIQTDAAVNPGNSGGALVNTAGELIGINTAIASRTGSFSGYSFAVPSSIAQKVAHDLITFGEVRRAYLGVQLEPVDEELAAELGLTEVAGCAIVRVVPNSGASEADLEIQDVILAVEEIPISNFPALQECIAQYHPGDYVNVDIVRNGQKERIQVQLKSRDGSVTDTTSARASEANRTDWIASCNAGFSSPSASIRNLLNQPHGIQVISLSEGPLKDAGIRKGYIITRINGEDITETEQIRNAFESGEGGLLVEGIYPNGKTAYYGVAIPK